MFVVYLTKYSGTKLPNWYIGSTYMEKFIDGYNGSVSSKKYKSIYDAEQKENKHLFKTRILSRHSSREEALTEELRVQRLHSVMLNDSYFNESYATVKGCFGRDVSGSNNPNYGNKWSDEQKRSASTIAKSLEMTGSNNPNYGNKWSDEQKENLAKQKRGVAPHNTIFYDIFNEFDEILYENVTGSFCRKLHKRLPERSSNNRLKETSGLVKYNKTHMVGWYTEPTRKKELQL